MIGVGAQSWFGLLGGVFVVDIDDIHVGCQDASLVSPLPYFPLSRVHYIFTPSSHIQSCASIHILGPFENRNRLSA